MIGDRYRTLSREARDGVRGRARRIVVDDDDLERERTGLLRANGIQQRSQEAGPPVATDAYRDQGLRAHQRTDCSDLRTSSVTTSPMTRYPFAFGCMSLTLFV